MLGSREEMHIEVSDGAGYVLSTETMIPLEDVLRSLQLPSPHLY